jgi:hypothetical protein
MESKEAYEKLGTVVKELELEGFKVQIIPNYSIKLIDVRDKEEVKEEGVKEKPAKDKGKS